MLNIEDIPALKWKHQCALQLFESLCKIADETGYPLEKTFLLGAQNGIEEIVRTIIDSYPTAIKNEGRHRTAFHVAVMYRHVKIFKMLYEKNIRNGQYLRMLNEKEKSVLDFVEEAGHQAGIGTDSGVVFKMQRELQWFMVILIFLRAFCLSSGLKRIACFCLHSNLKVVNSRKKMFENGFLIEIIGNVVTFIYILHSLE